MRRVVLAIGKNINRVVLILHHLSRVGSVLNMRWWAYHATMLPPRTKSDWIRTLAIVLIVVGIYWFWKLVIER